MAYQKRTKEQRKRISEAVKLAWAKKRKALEPQVLAESPTSDMVNHPSHYTFSKYEVADVADAWYPNEPLLWNANKYLARWDKKGDPIENLEKAVWYIQRKIAKLKAIK